MIFGLINRVAPHTCNPSASEPGTYVVTARSSLLDSCYDTCIVRILEVDITIDLLDDEPVPDPRSSAQDASGLDMPTLSITLNGNAVPASIMTISDIVSGSVLVGKKVQFAAPCSLLNLPGNNEIKANISDKAGNAMDEVTKSFTLP
jgi:hypothetical protein